MLLKSIELCKKIVEINNGRMQFYVNEGVKGNTFQFNMEMDVDEDDRRKMVA